MHLFLLAILFVLAGTTSADAAFLIAPIITAIFPALSAGLVTFLSGLIATGISIGLAYLFQSSQQPAGGLELEIRIDPLVPQSLLLGRCVLAGSRAYIESYGNDNKNCIEIIALADHPCEGLVKAYVSGQTAELTDTGGDRGFTVDEFDNNLAIKFYDGSQTTADAFTVSALSGHPERPWTSAMVGKGRTYARVHYKYNAEKVSQPLDWKFVIDGIRLYNPAKDSTVGGVGTHRWSDLSTHEFSSNLAVIAYNILRGIRVLNSSGVPVHFYGIENTPAENLPLDNWFAAIAEADVAMDKDGGGTEPQFHGGIETPVNKEPLETLREVLKATGGRLTELGGVYKLYLGAPGLPVAEIDDEVLLSNKGDTFKPILPLDQRFTYITGSYTAPEDDWVEKAAPPRVNSDREVDVGRRVPTELTAMMVQSNDHIQRLMQQILNRAGQQRRHTVPLPPPLFGVEPGDILSWTSDRNGYVDKLFEVEATEVDTTLQTVASLVEVDPADYDWDAYLDTLPSTPTLLETSRPAPKIIDSFDAEPYTHIGDTGARRPGIQVTWTPPDDDDIARLVVQIRLASSPSEIVNMTFEEPEVGEGLILANLAPNTAYEVRARFESVNNFATDWSLWIPVTTPDTRVTQAELDEALVALIESVEANLPPDIFTIRDDLDAITTSLNTQITVLRESLGRVNIGAGARFQENKAGIELVTTAVAGVNSALAGLFVDLFAVTEAGKAEGKLRFVASSAPGGVLARFAVETRAEVDDVWAFAGLYLDAGVTALGGGSRIVLVADQVRFDTGDGDTIFEDGVWSSTDGKMEIDMRIGRILISDDS